MISSHVANYPYNIAEWGKWTICRSGVYTPRRCVCRSDRPKFCHSHVQGHTMSIVGVICPRHHSTTHRPRHKYRRQFPPWAFWRAARRRRGFPLKAFFFQLRHHGIFRDPKMTANIPDPTAIQGLFFDLCFRLRQPGPIRVFPLKASLAVFAPVALCAMFAMTILHKIVMVTRGTFDLDTLFHVYISLR